jgi:hypothetical protein
MNQWMDELDSVQPVSSLEHVKVWTSQATVQKFLKLGTTKVLLTLVIWVFLEVYCCNSFNSVLRGRKLWMIHLLVSLSDSFLVSGLCPLWREVLWVRPMERQCRLGDGSLGIMENVCINKDPWGMYVMNSLACDNLVACISGGSGWFACQTMNSGLFLTLWVHE